MEDKYTPVNIEEIFPDFNTNKLNAIFNIQSKENVEKIDAIDFVLESLSVSGEEIKNKEVFFRNYIYCMIIARKHLLEIEERLKDIKQKMSKIKDTESYPFKKLKFFKKRNEDAKEQVTNFICYDLVKYITGRNDAYADLINRSNDENMWIIGPTYDYQYNSKYYNPEYDFSTFAKFYEIPDIPLIRFLENIEEMISIKSSSIEKYYAKVRETVEKKKLLDKMVDRVSCNYHMHHRGEIFESLLNLFSEKKYLAFVVNAAIQIEGMFYELVSIRYGKKEQQGTLVEKVDKTFGQNEVLRQALYPYFAFDVPDLRNQVAHKGIVEDDNIEMLAYELILDLNCIVSFVEKESIDKYKAILMIRDKLNEIDSSNYKNGVDYYKALSECLLCELYASNKIYYAFFEELISKPENFEDELNYYVPTDKDKNMIYLKDVVYAVSNLFKKEEFWQVVLEECSHITVDDNGMNDFGIFINKLKNIFIPILKGESKRICCEVNSKLQKIKEA